MVELTRDEAIGLADFLEITLFDAIRNDPDIDGMGWLCNMMMIYKKRCGLVIVDKWISRLGKCRVFVESEDAA